MSMDDKTREALLEICNRAANFMDDDAADWMASIYRIACDAIGEDPWPLLNAAGYSEGPKEPRHEKASSNWPPKDIGIAANSMDVRPHRS